MAEDNFPFGLSSRRGRRLTHLDGLRGIAAIGVMLYHVHYLYGFTLGFERGYLFVDLFFMLSGFVLSLAWAPEFERRASTGKLMIARLRRLWPMIAAAAVIGAGVHALLGDVDHIWLCLSLALLLVPLIGQSDLAFPLNGPQWSILWELIANFIHVRWFRRANTGKLLVVATIMALCLILAIELGGADISGPTSSFWWFAFARVGWSYTVGMLIARHSQTNDRGQDDRQQGAPWWLVLSIIVLVVLLVPFLPLSTATGDILVVLFAFPALFSILVTAQQPVKAERILSKLGTLSFPLYATHLALLTFFMSFTMPRILAAGFAVATSLLLAACLGSLLDRQKKVPRAKPGTLRVSPSGV